MGDEDSTDVMYDDDSWDGGGDDDQDTGAAPGSTDEYAADAAASGVSGAALPGVLTRYKPVCTNCGWEGSVGFEGDAVAEGNNHVDDHPKCAGRIEIRKVSWYDGSPVE